MTELGTIGSYNVREVIESGRFFVDKKELTPSGDEVVTGKIPVKKFKRVLELTHVTAGVTVSFTSYINRGQWRYKDSRKPKVSLLTPDEPISELTRMLDINVAEAKALLAIPTE
jgi:hypothetical protein